MTAYHNENDPNVAAGLREIIAAGLIPDGDVDERSIVDVRPSDLRGYAQCHFFAGIGGWPFALRLADRGGWRGWTGSCPCQPFSEAGRQRGFSDDRDLWPVWLDLIRECRPPSVLGEQVATGDGLVWAGRTGSDLEAENYAFGSAVLEAAGVGSPQRRQRTYFVAHAIGADAGGRPSDRWGRQVKRALAGAWPLEAWNGGFGRYERLADGLPGHLAKIIAGGFGNAIVPELAADFIIAAT